VKADDPIRISIEEMLDDDTIRDIGADHDDVAVCVTRICGHVRRQEEEIVEANGRLDMAMKCDAKLREALELALHVRGTSDDTAEVAAKMEEALGRLTKREKPL